MTVPTAVTDSAETGEEATEVPPVPDEPSGPESAVPENEPDTFPREYVERLREENAAHRVRAARADALEERLRQVATVAATVDLLHDPDDLAWSDDLNDEDGFPDPDKIRDAALRLIADKPHLAKVRGDVGQGRVEESSGAFSLAGMLRDRA